MHNPLDQFLVKPIIAFDMFGYDLSFTNSALFMAIACLLTALFLIGGVLKAAAVPGRLQAAVEMFYSTITEMVDGVIGEKGKSFIPFVFSLFIFILICNLLGMIPYGYTVNSNIIVTFALAIIVFVGATIVGFIKHGFHYFSLLLPEGTPLVMAPIMICIELFAYMVRPVSLSVRLAANMVAGHIVLKVVASFVIMMGFLGILPFTLLTILTGFEIFVALLQAYIFTILTCAYINDAVNLH